MKRIEVNSSEQKLHLYDGETLVASYRISTAAAGMGEKEGSYKTPGGKHEICQKIGDDMEPGTIFKGRVPTGEKWEPGQQVEKDLITTRILWLNGLEAHNRNSKERYIYIHGTNHEDKLGTPCSIGCVRMGNQDVMKLFDHIEIGTPVDIL